MKDKITENEYLQLVGLLTLGTGYFKLLQEIEKAGYVILGVEDELSGHFGDALFNEGTVKEVLKNMGIKIIKNGTQKLHN